MKRFIAISFLLLPLIFRGQTPIKPTETLVVRGEVKQAQTFSLENLRHFKMHDIKDLVVTNHLGEPKETATGLKGVLLKEVLASVAFTAENPKVLSEYYLIFTASDGYKVVYSWNEIFNTATGDNLYLITEKAGLRIEDQPERILSITTSDYKTGRRYIKGLAEIVVARVK